jgi:hypothetical protein
LDYTEESEKGSYYLFLSHRKFPLSVPFYRIPKEPSLINNHEGLKFHVTGNIKFTNTVIADNRFGIRYGALKMHILWSGLAIGNFDRRNPPASFNSAHGNYGQIALNHVTFFHISLVVYEDTRMGREMGNPVQSTDVAIVNSIDEGAKPKLGS